MWQALIIKIMFRSLQLFAYAKGFLPSHYLCPMRLQSSPSRPPRHHTANVKAIPIVSQADDRQSDVVRQSTQCQWQRLDNTDGSITLRSGSHPGSGTERYAIVLLEADGISGLLARWLTQLSIT